MSAINKIIYAENTEALKASLTGFEATQHTLQFEQDIRTALERKKPWHLFLKVITFGLACFFLHTLPSKEVLEARITIYRDFSVEMEQKARCIQRLFAKKLYKEKRIVSAKMSDHQSPQFNSSLSTLFSLGSLWLKQGYPNFWSGHRGQIIWDRTKTLASELRKEGNYVFLHAHSYPITLHLELSSHFQALHQSEELKGLKPEESRRKFRAPGAARLFANTAEYLRSYIGKLINYNLRMDNHYRESILSCDVIPDNNEAYESTQHFFKSNRSIVDTTSSTGMRYKDFDGTFIASFIKTSHFREYAVQLFATARQQLDGIADYGMIRIIAIAKETIQNKNTNYAWRAHPFGVLCTCKHSGEISHREFIETLNRHQEGDYEYCTVDGVRRTPQYRVLAANVDRDNTKQIYTMDCLNSEEKAQYNVIFNNLKAPLAHIIRLERIASSKTVGELARTLNEIDLVTCAANYDYKSGLEAVLKANKALILRHEGELSNLLLPEVYNYIRQLLH